MNGLRTLRVLPEGWLRCVIFDLGDGLFLVLVGTATTAAMHLLHDLSWNFALTVVVGMAVAMVLQMLLALSVSPLLGSIESMVPSMIVAMLGPMSVCTLDLMGYALSRSASIGAGAAFGVGTFVCIEIYGFLCRRSLRRRFPA
jgi:hypothetical protein